ACPAMSGARAGSLSAGDRMSGEGAPVMGARASLLISGDRGPSCETESPGLYCQLAFLDIQALLGVGALGPNQSSGSTRDSPTGSFCTVMAGATVVEGRRGIDSSSVPRLWGVMEPTGV
ncbi:MAG TPA: hypothetical protein VFH51_14430, partial [Myxococcota bacterium]|nr:hypothetical protein [Myxococcota bacterium]